MAENDPYNPAEEASSLIAGMSESLRGWKVHAVEDLSVGLSLSRVLRVAFETQDGKSGSAILKTTNHRSSSGVVSKDAFTYEREFHFARSELYGELSQRIGMPRILAASEINGKFHLLMEDVGELARKAWQSEDALGIAQYWAELDQFYVSHQILIERNLSWLGQQEYANYENYLPDCISNVTRRPRDQVFGGFFNKENCRILNEILGLQDVFKVEFSELPRTLNHGDFNIRNVRVREGQGFTVIDWANIGIGPIGCDIASFASVYLTFGGGWDDARDRHSLLIDAYATAVREKTGIDHTASIRRTVALWNLTWDLHTRLGPGLRAIESGYIADEAMKRVIANDIVEGCGRALKNFSEWRKGKVYEM